MWKQGRGEGGAVAQPTVTWALRSVDRLLRQRLAIEEFTGDAECIFRVSVDHAAREVRLSDGVIVREGDPVLQLHLWNEHVPAMPSAGPSASWANLMKRRTRHSLALVADYVERELGDVVAVHGEPPFGSRLGALQMIRTAERFGFDVLQPDGTDMRDRIHEIFDSMLLWGLIMAYNPAAARGKTLVRHRYQLWISRAKLRRLYGEASGRSAAAASH
jgi:hypothetical protein